MFTKLRIEEIHSSYTDDDKDDEDEEDNAVPDSPMIMEYHNGNNEIVKSFNQKCVICFEKACVYAFRQCGLQCKCEKCWTSSNG